MINLQKNLLSILLLVFVGQFATANNGIGKILDTQEDGRITVNTDCEMTVTFRVNATNWDPTQPLDLPAMYLIYEVSDMYGPAYAQTPEYVEVDPSEFENYGQTILGDEIYEWRIPVTIDMEDYFDNGGSPFLEYKLWLASTNSGSISTIGLNSFYDFPVYWFIGPDQFFSCEHFDAAFGQEDPLPLCDISIPYPYTTQQTGSLEIIQNLCGIGDFAGGGSQLQAPPVKEALSRSAQLDQADKVTPISFAPNPFSSELTAPVEVLENTDLELRVFDASGKMVHQQSQYLQKGAHQIFLDTSNWPQGLYYAQVKTGTTIQTHRLVKTNTH